MGPGSLNLWVFLCCSCPLWLLYSFPLLFNRFPQAPPNVWLQFLHLFPSVQRLSTLSQAPGVYEYKRISLGTTSVTFLLSLLIVVGSILGIYAVQPLVPVTPGSGKNWLPFGEWISNSTGLCLFTPSISETPLPHYVLQVGL